MGYQVLGSLTTFLSIKTGQVDPIWDTGYQKSVEESETVPVTAVRSPIRGYIFTFKINIIKWLAN